MAIIPPFDMVIDPESVPDAPASLSPEAEPAEEPASPADGPLPGWTGADVASDEKYEATELDDICGVKETCEVVAEGGEEDMLS